MTMTAEAATQLTADDAGTGNSELRELLFGSGYASIHADIRELLLDPIFDARPGLTASEAGRLAYERSRFVHGRLERPRQILAKPARLFALAEWPALLDVSVFSLLMVHYNLCFGTLVDHGAGRADLSDYFEELDSLKSFGPYMATELGFGNNVAAMRTKAVYDSQREVFELETPEPLAQKYMSYSGFTDIPKLAVVMARMTASGKDWGVFPFVVRISDEQGLCPGVRAAACPEKPVQGLDNGLTAFDKLIVPRRNLLFGEMGELLPDGNFRPTIANPRKRFLRAMSRIQPGRLCVASAAMGAARASVYIALRYGQHRLTNAPASPDLPIIEHRSYQLPTFTALAKVYALTLLLNVAKQEFLNASTEVSPEQGILISITKALCTWEASEVVGVCRERCGAQGMFSVNRVGDYVSLLQGLVTAEGDNLVLLATAAAQLLALPPHDAGKPLARASLAEAGPWLLGARERWLFDRARQHVEAPDAQSYFEAWNAGTNAALAMARTRGVRLALEALNEAARMAHSAPVRAALGLLAELYTLTELQRDAGFYVASGLLRAEEALELGTKLDGACAAIRPHVQLLLDGFALSPELLRAPIAHADYVKAFCEQVGSCIAN